jgi:phosphohistidine swiveling domain-containing protein
MDIKEYYKRQISLSEWFDTFGDKFDQASFRDEDNEKRERLRILNEIISMPFDKPTQFDATDISNNTKSFQKFYKTHKDEYCALRLIPLDTSLPKLRLRGVTVEKVLEWYKEQNIDPKKYRADFIPHSENALWSTIFICNENGIFGEIIRGMHNKLTQGFYEKDKPIRFSFNFKKLILSTPNKNAKKEIQKIISYLHVTNKSKRDKVTKEVKGKFANNYLTGYFETISTKDFGLWFIDYNRILGEKYSDFSIDLTKKTFANNSKSIKGIVASVGKVRGKVKILHLDNTKNVNIEKGDILVCEMTTPDHVIHMQKAAAIVTNMGGILCHAAIVAREFRIPCIVATNNATLVFTNGDLVEVDAIHGIVRKL